MEQRSMQGSNGSAARANGKNGKNGKAALARAGSRTRGGEALDRRLLLVTLTALKKGDFSVRLPIEWEGLDGRIAQTFNDVVELNQKITSEFERVSRVVGKEGKITERASI